MKKLLSMSQRGGLKQALFLVFSLLLSFSVVTGCGEISAQRSIVAEAVNGTVMATIPDLGWQLVRGEKMESGYFIDVYDDSDLTMLLDSDKHVYAGEGTSFNLDAEGSKGSSATRLMLIQGTLKCAIDKKLKAEESFEVETPNAALAVRGTIFTVSVRESGSGYVTEVSVEEGQVEVTTEENGVQKTTMISAGQSDTFEGNKSDKSQKESNTSASSQSGEDTEAGSAEKNDNEKDPFGTEASEQGPAGDGGGDDVVQKSGMTYEYKITGGTRSDGEAFTAEDIDMIFLHPFMYLYVYDDKTRIEPPCWNAGDTIGAAIEDVEKGFTSGTINADHYNSDGEMSYFVELNVTLNGSSATIYDVNAQETFYLTLVDSFKFEE